MFSAVRGCDVIAEWSERWCAKPEALGLIHSFAVAEFFLFLHPDVRAFFLSTGVLGMD